MRPHETLAIVFLVVATISTLSSGLAMYTIWRFGKWTTSTKLLLLLHFTLLLEEVTTLPYAYSGNDVLCKIFGFLHVYSGLSNIVATGLLTVHFCNFILFSNLVVADLIAKYNLHLIFGFPLITVLPFSTNSYGVTNDNWCSLPASNLTSNVWSMVVFYSWTWLILAFSFGLICYVIDRARKLDSSLSRKVFSSMGIYVFFTMLCWLPRTIPRFMRLFIRFDTSDTVYFWTTLPLYLTGLIYTIILFWDRAVLKVEDNTGRSISAPIEGEDINFTWDTFDDAMADHRLTTSTVTMNTMHSKGIF